MQASSWQGERPMPTASFHVYALLFFQLCSIQVKMRTQWETSRQRECSHTGYSLASTRVGPEWSWKSGTHCGSLTWLTQTLKTWVTTSCLPLLALLGSWGREWSWDSNPDIPIWIQVSQKQLLDCCAKQPLNHKSSNILPNPTWSLFFFSDFFFIHSGSLMFSYNL